MTYFLVSLLVSMTAAADGQVPNPWVGTVITKAKSIVTNPGANDGKITITSESTLTVRIPESGPAQVDVSASYSQQGTATNTFQAMCNNKFSQQTGSITVSETGSGQNQMSDVHGNFLPGVGFDKKAGTYEVREGGGFETKFKATGTYKTHSSNPCDHPQDYSLPLNEAMSVQGPGGTGTSTFTVGPSGELPKSVSGTWTDPEPNMGSIVFERTITWNLSRGAPDVHAKTSQSTYTVDRGQFVILDASPSTGPITEYKWELSAGSDCGDNPPPATTMKGKQILFTALCAINAKLTVSDDRGSDLTSATVKVNARTGWATKIEQTNTVENMMYGVGLGSEGGMVGKNRCSLDADPDAHHHWIHQTSTTTWADVGYQLAPVLEKNAPFSGYWYVATQTLHISRAFWLNATLFPRGEIEDLNSNGLGNPADLATMISAARVHELLHTSLVQDWFTNAGPSWDPATRIEKVFGKSQETATNDADSEIRSVESELNNTDWHGMIKAKLSAKPYNADPYNFTRSGWVSANSALDGDGGKLSFSSFAGLGATDDQ